MMEEILTAEEIEEAMGPVSDLLDDSKYSLEQAIDGWKEFIAQAEGRIAQLQDDIKARDEK